MTNEMTGGMVDAAARRARAAWETHEGHAKSHSDVEHDHYISGYMASFHREHDAYIAEVSRLQKENERLELRLNQAILHLTSDAHRCDHAVLTWLRDEAAEARPLLAELEHTDG